MNGVWKWIAAILAAILLAGFPALFNSLTAPTREEVDLIRDRQSQVLQRLAVTEEEIHSLQVMVEQLQEDLKAHERAEREGR